MLIHEVWLGTEQNRNTSEQKQNMKKLCRVLPLVVGCVLAAQVAHAQDGDLVIGFNHGSGATPLDYGVNLGLATSFIGGTSVEDMSTHGFDFSTFTAQYTSLSSGVSMGAVGGDTGLGTMYVTALRTANPGNPTISGSTRPTIGSASDAQSGATSIASFNAANNLNNQGNSVTIAPNNANSWFGWILDTSGTIQSQNFFSVTGLNPSSTTSGTVLTEDLWFFNGSSTTPTYEGFFSLDTGAGKLTYTPSTVAVPEPSTYGLLAGAGLLIVMLRNRLSRKSA
jgi:hypothetical protein